MKTVPAGLQTLIGKQVTTLAYCWEFTRRDGLVLRFTDHDVPLERDAPRTALYEALSGFTRSALEAKGDLSVDNTDIVGLYESDAITEEDLRKGLWDFAEYVIFLADWVGFINTEKIILRRGFLGQVSIKDTMFEVEQRGLTQALSVVSGDVYSPLCRVDLFSTECGLTAATWKQESSVASLTNRRRFVAEAKLQIFEEPVFEDAEAVEVSIDEDTGYATWDEATPDGSEEHPYQISSQSDVDDIRNDMNAHYVLTQDVDMSGWGNFTPIPSINGLLDGRGYEIQNLDLDDTSQVLVHTNGDVGWGMFVRIGEQGIVRRLGLKSPSVRIGAGSHTPMGPFAGMCFGRIENCWVEGGTITVTGNTSNIGGLVGQLRRATQFRQRIPPGPADRGTIINSWAAISWSGSIVGSKHGGITGKLDTSTGAVATGTYFDSTVAGHSEVGENGNATPLTTAQMKQSSNFSEYDLQNVWEADDGVDYLRHLDPGRGNGTDPAFLRFAAEDLTFAGTYSSSVITWTADEPGASAIAVQSSRDGKTWSACTSGVEIPGFTPSESLSGEYLSIRVNFVDNGSDVPTLETLDWKVVGQANAFDASALASDEWFKAGHLRWVSGLNAGIAMEVKSWSASTKEIVLFLEMPFDISVGDKFEVYPGCQKRILEDCRDKFTNVENFRGEPNVPGTDQLLRLPDAQG